MSEQPLEPESVEYLDPNDSYAAQRPQVYVYQNERLPCCSGCGCLALGLAIIFFWHISGLISAVIMVIIAAWLAGVLLKIAGVRRFSSNYVYIMVPVFLTIMNVLWRITGRGYLYSTREIVIGTLIIYVLIYISKRQPTPRI